MIMPAVIIVAATTRTIVPSAPGLPVLGGWRWEALELSSRD